MCENKCLSPFTTLTSPASTCISFEVFKSTQSSSFIFLGLMSQVSFS